MTQKAKKMKVLPSLQPEDYEQYEDLKRLAEMDEDEQMEAIVAILDEVREEMWHENWRYDNEKQCWRYIGEKQAEPIKPPQKIQEYKVKITPNKNGGFYAICNTENGGFNTMGDTIHEIQKNMLESAELYFEDSPNVDYLLNYEVVNA